MSLIFSPALRFESRRIDNGIFWISYFSDSSECSKSRSIVDDNTYIGRGIERRYVTRRFSEFGKYGMRGSGRLPGNTTDANLEVVKSVVGLGFVWV